MRVLYLQTTNTSLAARYKSRPNYSRDAGVDLYCPVELTIPPRSQAKIDFAIKCELVNDTSEGIEPFSYWLVPRSSICKTPLRMSNSIGLIDQEFRGSICAFVDNISDQPYTIQQFDRLFQLCLPSLEPISKIEIDTTGRYDFLSSTQRGEGGIGSTGR